MLYDDAYHRMNACICTYIVHIRVCRVWFKVLMMMMGIIIIQVIQRFKWTARSAERRTIGFIVLDTRTSCSALNLFRLIARGSNEKVKWIIGDDSCNDDSLIIVDDHTSTLNFMFNVWDEWCLMRSLCYLINDHSSTWAYNEWNELMRGDHWLIATLINNVDQLIIM